MEKFNKLRCFSDMYLQDKNKPELKRNFISDKDSAYLWLLKPVNLNRGRGIEVFSSLEQLEKLLNEYYTGFI